MKINGIGNVTHRQIESIMTDEGVKALRSGLITWEEGGEMYKLHLVRKLSRTGRFPDTFNANYDRIPDSVKGKLSPEELAELTDAFCDCYGAGKNAGGH